MKWGLTRKENTIVIDLVFLFLSPVNTVGKNFNRKFVLQCFHRHDDGNILVLTFNYNFVCLADLNICLFIIVMLLSSNNDKLIFKLS